MKPERVVPTEPQSDVRAENGNRDRRTAERARLLRRCYELEGQLAELTAANQALGRFVAEAAHELTEPLVIVESSALLLREALDGDLPPHLAARLDSLGSTAARSRLLVESLLEDARSAQHPPKLEPGDLRVVIDDALSLVMPDHARLGPRVQVGPMPTIITSPALISIVLRNLLVNASKYGVPHDGEILVSAERTPRGWTVSVVSQGAHIPLADAQRLFQPFEQSATNGRRRGAGLGLAICARVVARLGGTLGVAPEPGGGNRFVIELPARADRPVLSRPV